MSKDLSAKFVEGVRTSKTQEEFFDGEVSGLALRVTSHEKKSWTFHYTSPKTGKRVRMTIGTYPATSLADARTRAREVRGKVEKGLDPREAEATGVPRTMKQLVDKRLDWMTKEGKRKTAEVRRMFYKDVLEVVGEDKLVIDFTIPDRQKIIDAKGDATYQANRVCSYLRTLFKFAAGMGAVPYSPIANCSMPYSEKVRKRVLSLDEIVIFWDRVDGAFKCVSCKHYPTILKLCLVLGQRVGEIAGMRRDEIDVKKRIWKIPGERTKNKHDHIVPLSDLAWALISEAMARGGQEYLFPRFTKKKGPELPVIPAVIAQALRRAMTHFGFKQAFRTHDLRRTLATQISEEENNLAIMPLAVEHILNHRSVTHAGITKKAYNQAEEMRAKRTGLALWGEFLTKLTAANDDDAKIAA